MGGDAFVVVFLKPEIATNFFKFATCQPESGDDDDAAAPPAVRASSIAGVSAVEAAFLLPNGHIIPTLFTRIKAKGFEIAQQRMRQLTKAEARMLFSYEQQHHFTDDTPAFAAFLNAITSGPSLALVLKLPAALALGDANAAIKKWVELAGDWDPVAARKKALAASIPHDQWPLRALCGLNAIQNGISSSPHVCCSRRERFFLMPPAVPQLERATIVLLPSFRSNSPGGADILLSTIAKEVRAVVVESLEGCTLADDQVLALCGLKRAVDEEPGQQTCESVVQLAQETVGTTGVHVIVLEGLDLSYTLRFAVGPANVDVARLYFPESVRGQVASKLPSVELPAGLHPDKAADDDALGFESGLFLSFDSQLNIAKTTHEGIPIEFTLGLIKPNAACKAEVVAEILRMINLFGFTVERQRRLLLSRDQAGAFYAEHRGKSFFETLLSFMTSGEVVALHLSRPHAIKTWRGLMGPTNSIRARETYPWTLQARFGVDGTRNSTHGSDSTASAARELRFFFGKALSASSTISTVPSTQSVAQQPVVGSGTTESSVEKILAQGLKELMEKKVSDPLEACRWLGEWLVTYRSREQEQEPESLDEARLARGIKPKASVKRAAEGVNSVRIRKVVAITLDASVGQDLRSAVLTILRKQLEDARYEVVDIDTELKRFTAMDAAVANLVKKLKDSGRSRCVLFGCEELTQNSVFHREFETQAPADWQINFVVRLDLQKSSGNGITAGSATYSPSFKLPIFHFSLPSTHELRTDAALHGLFQTVFDPSIVLLADPKKLIPATVWTEVSQHFGFHLVTFEAFITSVKNSNDDSDDAQLLLELMRSGSNVPAKLILPILRRIILGSQPGSSNFAQKFMLLGFPWSDIPAVELEQVVGRPQSVVLVGERGQRFNPKSSSPDPPTWVTPFRKKGLLKRVWIDSNVQVDRVTVCSAIHAALAPVVGCFLGKSDLQEQLQLQLAAKAQGFIWIDCALSSVPSVQKLSEFLMRAHAGREKLLLYGYPPTPAQATEFLNLVGPPQFVIHNSSSASPVAAELLAVFDAHPSIAQLDLASSANAQTSNGPSKLRSIFFRKQVVAAVGSVATLQLSLAQLRDVVAPLGYDVVEFKHGQASPQRDGVGRPRDLEKEQIRELERQVDAVQAPRCLVIGAPESPSFYHALEARIGCSMHKILILQQVPVRVCGAKNDEGPDDYSDEEQGHVHVEEDDDDSAIPARSAVRWRKVMQALSPQLSLLATSSSSSISVDVLGFLSGSSRVVQDVVARLRPRFCGVVGHAFSFYQRAARGFCRRHLVGFVDLPRVSSSLEALEILETLVATTPHAVYCLDGFPRASLSDEMAPSESRLPRYVAQQVWELDRRLGALTTLVHFTTTNALEESEHVTRRMLEDAQDELELASADLVRWFSTGKKTISEVTCDRTVADAQEEMDRVLQRTLRPSRPVVTPKDP
ncbi:NME NM23 member 5 [Phytophthora pseudosyringae]|uniref:NME NM23 member 5 n=1 Tax=Phytophthora pseudosyringae TaxID=221518 RepID=A0A8T1WCW4_9STRA|nr:NME NM23 member 5 [Phytophthora pseudosyringae]